MLSSVFAARPAPDQATAARAALTGTRLTRLRIGAGALGRLLRHPEQTEHVFVLGLALNASSFPALLARFRADPDGAALLREQPAIDSHHVDLAALAALPADTLGGAFARFLHDRQLDPDLFQPPPGLPAEAPYTAQRVRQPPDLLHVLTGHPTDVAGGVALQGFTFGQLRMPSALAIATVGTLRYGLATRGRGQARLARRVRAAMRAGRAARFLPTVRWEQMWTRPLAEVRAELGIVPVA